MPASSLTQLTRQTLIKNISSLTDIGDIPYDIIRPVLLKLENPNQLQILEEASPQLYGADDELWISFIKRDIPDAESKMLYPKNPKSWWKVYRKMRQTYEAEAQEDATRLKAAFTGLKSAKDKRQIQIKEGVPHIPKLDGMQFAHIAEYNRIKKPVKKAPLPTSVLRFGGGSKTKVLTGRGVMDKARREAQELTRFTAQSKLAVPTHKLSSVATQVREAPKHMVDGIRTASPKPVDPSIPKPVMFIPPRKRPVESKNENNVSGVMTIEERERRLRALTNPSNAVKVVAVTSSSTAPKTSGSSAKSPLVSVSDSASHPTATPSVTPKPTSSVSAKALSAASSTPSSTDQKRKAEEVSTDSTTEVGLPTSTDSQIKSTLSPPQYKVPRLIKSPEASGVRPSKKKAPVDPFMPVKKRRIS